LGWQEKCFSHVEEHFYQEAKEEDFQGNVLKKKFFRDVQAAQKRSQILGQKIFTCLDGELYEHDEVRYIFNLERSFTGSNDCFLIETIFSLVLVKLLFFTQKKTSF
jgi:hypothetical protein